MFNIYARSPGIRLAALSAVLFIGATLAPVSQASVLNFTADLDGIQAASGSAATGAAKVQFDTLSGALSIDLAVTGIGLADLRNVGPNATPMHIHFAPTGSNGPIVFDLGFFGPFVDDAGTLRSSVTDVIYQQAQGALTSSLSLLDFEQALRTGSTYLNIHTNSFPAGEIRGQLAQVPVAASLLLMAGGLMGMVRVGRQPSIVA